MIVTPSRTPLTARVSASRMMRGVGGEAGGELRRRLALDLGQVGARQVGEHALLQLADHQQHELLDQHGLAVLRRRLGRGDDHHQHRHLVQDALVAGDEHGDRAVDHHRVERRSARP